MPQNTDNVPRQLTGREKQVLKLITDGYSNIEVGKLLNISSRTAEAHRARIMVKLALNDLPGLVKYALREGLTDINQHRIYNFNFPS